MVVRIPQIGWLAGGDEIPADQSRATGPTVVCVGFDKGCPRCGRLPTGGRNPDQALSTLHEAVGLATQERIYRPFLTLDRGLEPRRIRPLLNKLVQIDPAHLRFVLDLDHLDPATRSGDPPPLLDPLTHRELAVLQLLPTVQSNQEIARDLLVSVNTVKAYLRSMYRKLDVPNRRTAVQRGRSLGVIRELPIPTLTRGAPGGQSQDRTACIAIVPRASCAVGR